MYLLGESFNKYPTSLHTTQHQYPGNRMEEGANTAMMM